MSEVVAELMSKSMSESPLKFPVKIVLQLPVIQHVINTNYRQQPAVSQSKLTVNQCDGEWKNKRDDK